MVSIVFYCGSRARKDLDNMAKLVMDACTGIVWGDDSQVDVLNIRRVRGAITNPRTELKVVEL